MDLKLFFDPVSIDVSGFPVNSFVSSIYVNTEFMPDHEGMDIAIIGLRENRGGNTSEGYTQAADEIRKQLFGLKKGAGTFKIIDLGNFRNGPEWGDSILRLKEVMDYLMGQEILPLLIGGTHDLDWGQYLGYESAEKLITVLGIDNTFDFQESKQESLAHLGRIFKHDPNYLFNYYHLGHQSYLIHHKQSDLMERMSFEAIRLGVVKENIKDLEPVVRDADMLSFDISALQAHYAPGATDSKVYGLTGEEACQICWYAGLNDKLSSAGFYEYDVAKDADDRKTAFVVATMIWYFIEGFYNRVGEKSFMSNDYLVYEVALGGEPESIKFFKSRRSEKWWMEVPNPEAAGLFNRNRMVACNYADYEVALKGEVPDRWMNFYRKV